MIPFGGSSSPPEAGGTRPPARTVMAVSATPGGPLLSFDAVPPCPGAPRKSRPPPGHFDLSGDAPVRRLGFDDPHEDRGGAGRHGQQQQQHAAGPSTAEERQQHQPREQKQQQAAQRPPQLYIPEDPPSGQQHPRGHAPAPAGEAGFSIASPEQQRNGGPVHHRPQHQRAHPYHPTQQQQQPGAAAAAMDLISPTAFATPPTAKTKRAPSTPVRLFR